MTSVRRDPRRGRRLLRALLGSMGLSVACGVLLFLSEWPPSTRAQWTVANVKPALKLAVGYSTATFWLLFAIFFFAYARKSAATLDYERRRRRDELHREKGTSPPGEEDR